MLERGAEDLFTPGRGVDTEDEIFTDLLGDQTVEKPTVLSPGILSHC